MASLSIQSLLIAGVCLIPMASAQINSQLVGTWSTKSAKVLTGPGFYNPVNDSFIEPSHTGISYSFTSDGFYEEAYYRAAANATNPSCPQAIMQFQHGTVIQNADGSLTFSPFAVDGRQLQSNPCGSDNSVYMRYNQSETMKKWQVYVDPYTKMTRLDLYKFDGSPMNPMFLVFNPPLMLPTVTLNPSATAKPTSTAKAKRAVGRQEEMVSPLNKDVANVKRTVSKPLLDRVDPNMVWWAGIGMTIFGGAAYLL